MIFVGKYAGFCPGVQRAVDKAEELAEKKTSGSIYTLGMLIHNKTVVGELEKKRREDACRGGA